MDIQKRVETFLERRKALSEMLPSYSADEILYMALVDEFKREYKTSPNQGLGQGELKSESHEEFIKDAIVPVKKTRSAIPTGRLNYSGKQLQKLRIEKGLSQKEVEAQMGWNATYLSNIERGKLRFMHPSVKEKLLSIYS